MNDTGIGCATLCGECCASSAATVDGCDVLKFVASTIKTHNGEVYPGRWAVGRSSADKLRHAFTDVHTFRALLKTVVTQRGLGFSDGLELLEWRAVGMRGTMTYRYAQLQTCEGTVLPEARSDFYDLLVLPANPRSRIDAARILARRALTPGTGFDVWDSRIGMFTRIGGVQPFFPETTR